MGIIGIGIGYRDRGLSTLIIAFIDYFALLDALVGEPRAVTNGR